MSQHKVDGLMGDTFVYDMMLAIAKGNVIGHSHRHVVFASSNVGTTPLTVGDLTTEPPYPSTASVINISSNNSEDTALTGTGAWYAELHGLDSNWNEVRETVALNGSNTVTSVGTFIRLFSIHTHAPVGSTGGAVGLITAYLPGTPDTAWVQANDGRNTSLSALFTVPANQTGYLIYGDISSGKGKDLTADFYSRPYQGAFILSHPVLLYESGYNRPFPVPIPMPEKTDLKVVASSDVAGAKVGGTFDIILVDNP